MKAILKHIIIPKIDATCSVKFIAIILLSILCLHAEAKLKTGIYRGILLLDSAKNIELPFNFEILKQKKKYAIVIKNGDEKIRVDEITLKGDSLFFKMPVFDTEFKTKIKGNSIEGVWINHYRKDKRIIQFKAEHNNAKRFLFEPQQPNPIFEGRWKVQFSPDLKDSSAAIGVFHHHEQTDLVTGTFLTETGDYRYLEGMKHDNKLYLSCFDGSHAFLFIAENINDTLTGIFYSGAHWQEKWVATKNKFAQLRKPDEITVLKNSTDKINFSFVNLTGKKISLADKAYENKAVIIQIMGSWCPNCMDESAYLSGIYKQYKNEGLEIIALAYEKTTDLNKATQQVTRLKNKFNIDYEILITSFTGKEKASECFPMLTKIIAFPTTLFLNKNHEIVKTHTGFSGPATGKEYEVFKVETEKLINQLIKN